MIIQSLNNVIKYDGTQILNLMDPPSPNSEGSLYRDYFNFMDSVDFIYGTQNPENGTIPVFKTVSDPITNRSIPDKDSTLHFLVPGQSYFIKIKTQNSLPVKLPTPFGLSDFIYQNYNSFNNNVLDTCCANVEINNKIINLQSTNVHAISVIINNAKSNEKYYYEFIPIYSNWPASITPISGYVTTVANPNENIAQGNIESTLIYAKKLFDDIISIPYTLDKNIKSEYYTENIFTILNLKVFDPHCDCPIYDDNIIVACNSCVDAYSCPKINLSSTFENNQFGYISANLSDLQPNTEYSYEFSTESSNCAARISPLSGVILTGETGGTATINSFFKFCENPNSDECNLPSTSISTDSLIAKRVYQNLAFTLRTDDNTLCSSVKESILIDCENCFESTDFNTSISFSAPTASEGGTVKSKTFYPYPLLDNISYSHWSTTAYRPEIEHVIHNGQAKVYPASSGLLVPCCEKSIVLRLEVDNAISGDKYLFDIYSYPEIDIVPRTGIVSFSEGSGNFSVLVNAKGQLSSSLHAVLTHEKSNKQASDSTIVSCVPTGVYEAASLAAANINGWYIHPS